MPIARKPSAMPPLASLPMSSNNTVPMADRAVPTTSSRLVLARQQSPSVTSPPDVPLADLAPSETLAQSIEPADGPPDEGAVLATRIKESAPDRREGTAVVIEVRHSCGRETSDGQRADWAVGFAVTKDDYCATRTWHAATRHADTSKCRDGAVQKRDGVCQLLDYIVRSSDDLRRYS